MSVLTGLCVAIIATDGVEESELIQPMQALKEQGARVELLTQKPGTIQTFRHFEKATRLPSDRLLQDADPGDYDAILLPGGAINADTLRLNEKVRAFIQDAQEHGKPIAAICHAPWILVSAQVVRGRTLTSYSTLQDDIRNAGGNWVDQEVVVDNNWVTSRMPSDLPAFVREMVAVFSRATPPVIQVEESA